MRVITLVDLLLCLPTTIIIHPSVWSDILRVIGCAPLYQMIEINQPIHYKNIRIFRSVDIEKDEMFMA